MIAGALPAASAVPACAVSVTTIVEVGGACAVDTWTGDSRTVAGETVVAAIVTVAMDGGAGACGVAGEAQLPNKIIAPQAATTRAGFINSPYCQVNRLADSRGNADPAAIAKWS